MKVGFKHYVIGVDTYFASKRYRVTSIMENIEAGNSCVLLKLREEQRYIDENTYSIVFVFTIYHGTFSALLIALVKTICPLRSRNTKRIRLKPSGRRVYLAEPILEHEALFIHLEQRLCSCPELSRGI